MISSKSCKIVRVICRRIQEEEISINSVRRSMFSGALNGWDLKIYEARGRKAGFWEFCYVGIARFVSKVVYHY